MDNYDPQAQQPPVVDPMRPEPGLDGVYPETWGLGALRGAPALFKSLAGTNFVRDRLIRNAVVGGDVQAAKQGVKVTLKGRSPTAAEDVTHAYRRTDSNEIEAAIKAGKFRANPSKKYGDNAKWWSAGDEMGPFGRPWNKGPELVRVPIGKVPDKGAVRLQDAERFDASTGTFSPFKKGGAVKARKQGPKQTNSSKRGDGIAQRGKTKGRFV